MGVRPLASVFAATTLCEGEGSDPFAPTPLASQRAIALEGWGKGRRSRTLGLRPMTFDLLPGDWTQERPARPRPHLPGRLFGQFTDPGRTRTLGIAASGPRIGAWPPARRGLRTTAPGSCAEGRFQDRRRLISEARAEKHISPRPSCSVCLHHQSQKPVPGLSSARGQSRGQTPRPLSCRPRASAREPVPRASIHPWVPDISLTRNSGMTANTSEGER
jgi:hypothetical protein